MSLAARTVGHSLSKAAIWGALLAVAALVFGLTAGNMGLPGALGTSGMFFAIGFIGSLIPKG